MCLLPNGQFRWLNIPAFSSAPEGRRGNTERGQFRGHGLHVWDLSFRKGFPVVGDTRVQIQADVFNLFDRVSFRNPESNMQNSGFGWSTRLRRRVRCSSACV